MIDERYRRALKVQKSTILSSTGTGPVLRQIVEDWTGTPAVSYRDIPPANVEIGAIVDPDDEALLIRFLERAKPGGVRLFPLVASEAPLLVGHHSVSIDAGFIGHHSISISGARPIAHLGAP